MKRATITTPDITRVWAQRVIVVALWLTAVLLWRRHQTSNGLSATDAAQQFIDSVELAWWGIAAFVGVYLARPLVLFPASILTIVGGVLFGPVVGVLVVVVAANCSAMIAYTVGRLLGRAPGHGAGTSTPTPDPSGSVINRWASRMRDNSFETVLIMRFLFLPYDLVNYGAGALRIRWAPFLAATALGSLPGTVSFVLLGASLDRVDQGLDGLDPRALVASAALFVASLAVARLVKQRQTAVADPDCLPSSTATATATATATPTPTTTAAAAATTASTTTQNRAMP
jgi:uncharacterized membrane protein YdjX (TVP38/TMEM64 family)